MTRRRALVCLILVLTAIGVGYSDSGSPVHAASFIMHPIQGATDAEVRQYALDLAAANGLRSVDGHIQILLLHRSAQAQQDFRILAGTKRDGTPGGTMAHPVVVVFKGKFDLSTYPHYHGPRLTSPEY